MNCQHCGSELDLMGVCRSLDYGAHPCENCGGTSSDAWSDLDSRSFACYNCVIRFQTEIHDYSNFKDWAKQNKCADTKEKVSHVCTCPISSLMINGCQGQCK